MVTSDLQPRSRRTNMEYDTFIAMLEDLEADFGQKIIQVHELVNGGRRFYFANIEQDAADNQPTKEQTY